MIIDVDSYYKNEDIQKFTDFIYTSVQKGGPAFEYQWSILNEISLESAKTGPSRSGTIRKRFSALWFTMQQKLKATGHLSTEGVSAILSRAGRGNLKSLRNRKLNRSLRR